MTTSDPSSTKAVSRPRALGLVVISLRQAIVPDRLIGRVNSAFQQLSFGMLPLGSALGGTLGRTLGSACALRS